VHSLRMFTIHCYLRWADEDRTRMYHYGFCTL
jgi:hypothetical protein